VNQLVPQVVDELQKRQRDRAAQYVAVVRSAAGADPSEFDPAEVADILEAAGKQPADLTHDVARMAQRLALRERADMLAELDEELTGLKREYDAEMSKWNAVEKAHHERLAPITARVEELEALKRGAHEARRQLRAGYRGPLLDVLRTCYAEQGRLQERQARLQEERSRVKSRLHSPVNNYRPLTRAARENYEAAIKSFDGQLAETEAAIRAQQAAAQNAEAGMLEV
jgi:chromosome segregation ATPase